MATSTTTLGSASQSLYLQNLPEKMQKQDLRRSLYVLFSTYAPVLDVKALKTGKMRGQAHILFRDVHSATQALRSCQGLEFYGREMKISYSRNRSDTLAKLTGTFNQPSTRVASTTKPDNAATSLSTAAERLPQSASKQGDLTVPPGVGAQDAPSPQGVKRPRMDSESDGAKRAKSDKDPEDEAVPMEEDDDEDEGAMEMSDDDEDD